MEPPRVLLAVSGGIAAYKVPELVRLLRRTGHAVRCILTREAQQFVTPLVLQTLSGAAVRSQLFDASEEGEIDHIALADWAQLLLVAPATANLLAKLALGLADDLVSTVALATRAPIVVAPSMNVNMWRHPATQGHLGVLRERGVRVVGPESGELACGWEGEGRMSEPATIVGAIAPWLGPRSLAGEVVLVTAGGTREPLDAVRFLGNRSSGKMGFAVAAEALRRGAEVVLIAGPSAQPTPVGVRRVDVETALAMRDAVFAELPRATIVVKAAAVSDYAPAAPSDRKIKKNTSPRTLDLVPTPDILKEIAPQKGSRIVVGFAAETDDLVGNARRKLLEKGLDLIVANDVSGGRVFGDEEASVVILDRSGKEERLPGMSKAEIAERLLDLIEQRIAG